MNVEYYNAKLAQFLDNNPPSKVVEQTLKDVTIFTIEEPWSDKSLSLILSDDEELFEALNNVRLPDRLSAIWHIDTKDLEVLWTARRLPTHQKEIIGRSFKYSFKETTHICEFGESTMRTLRIASMFKPNTLSNSFFRNLDSFHSYAFFKPEEREEYGLDKPVSFFIRNIDWHEDCFNEFLLNINFYLTYYDDRSPKVMIHDTKEVEGIVSQKTRYVADTFPASIDGRELDNNLLAFWSSASSGNAMMRFLLYFRIIEYAATHYIEHKAKTEIRKILASPIMKGNLTTTMEKIVSTIATTKLDDTQKFKAVIRECVDAKLVWKEIEPNIDRLSKTMEFDGGFTAQKIATQTDTEESWCGKGCDSVSDTIRKIRNALSHGKDMETAGVITPTDRNMNLLAPWVNLVATIAGEVVLYQDTI